MDESRRDTITAQCAYLVDEVRALEPLLRARVSETFLEARPLGAWSIKEILGHLADVDRHVFRPRLQQLASESNPQFEPYDQEALVVASGWQDLPLADILDTVCRERVETIALLEALSDDLLGRMGRTADGREQDVLGLAAEIARHDAHHLRAIAYRLHESHISARADDLPK